MTIGRVSGLATWPSRLGWALLLVAAMSFGCVDLTRPAALNGHDGGAAGRAGGSTASSLSSGTGGSSAGSSSATAGIAGTTASTGGTGGTPEMGGSGGGPSVDAGTATGGTTSPTTGLDAMGGNTDIDAPVAADAPPATGGTATDAKVDGTGGSTGTGSDAKDSKIADTKVSGDAGLDSGRDAGIETSAADARDAAAPDSADAPVDVCVLCTVGTTLVHRYNFDGTGTTVTDSVGGAAGVGTVIGTTLSGSGTLVLSGGSDQYVDLPDKFLSTHTSATLEFWVTWSGNGNNNQRIMDFGNNVQDGSAYRAISTVILSPNSTPKQGETPRLRASFCKDVSVADSSIFVDSPTTSLLPAGSQQQIVVVFDGTNHTLAMYLNGVLQAQNPWTDTLSSITDTNVWLGRSQYSNDPGFNGTYHEVRMYNAPLTAAQVQAVFAAGTEATFTR